MKRQLLKRTILDGNIVIQGNNEKAMALLSDIIKKQKANVQEAEKILKPKSK